MSGLLHIASFVVHHRPESIAALDAALARLPDTELALRAAGRSVLLCEGDSEAVLLDRIDALRALDGVLGVSLVYHHAEPREALIREIVDEHTP